VHDDFAIPSVLDWEIAKSERPVGRAEHFDCDRKPVEDLTANEVLGIARFEAFENKRSAIACRKHLRDLIKWHGKGHL
jgi:hypothetical protein